MLKFAIVYLIVFASIAVAQPSARDKYEVNKKSLGTGIALEVFFTGAGNAYAKNGVLKTIVYPSVYYASVTAGLIGSINAPYREHRPVWLFTGLGLAGIVKVISVIDVINGIELYNGKLKEKYELVMNGDRLQLVYKF